MQIEPQLAEGEILVTGVEYGSLMEALESDHKPVYAVLRVNIPITDQVRLGSRSQLMPAARFAPRGLHSCLNLLEAPSTLQGCQLVTICCPFQRSVHRSGNCAA